MNDPKEVILPEGHFTLALTVSRIGCPPANPEVILCQASDQGQSLLLEAMPDGGLRFTAWFRRAGELPEGQIQGVRIQRAKLAHLPYWRQAGDPVEGSLSVCVPGHLIEKGRAFGMGLNWDGLSLRLLVDGVCVDEDWPYGEMAPPRGALRWRAGGGFKLSEPQVRPLVIGQSGVAWRGANAVSVAQRADELLGPERPFGQYWRPRGINTSAGDVMTCFDGQRLHVLSLNDRRNHGSRWGCGACGFEHWSTGDLREWVAHPPVLTVERGAECAIGTGGMLRHQDGYVAWGIVLSNRLGQPAGEEAPAAVVRATSRDGIHFQREPGAWLDACEPGIWFEESTGIYHLVRPGARMESRDLKTWTMADADFLPPPARIGEAGDPPTSECYTVFRWNGWFYILGGRTGFWMARDIRGPFWPGADGKAVVTRPRWDLYDGSMVPQGVVVWDNRALLCAWVVDYWWGGSLVFRELNQQADGTLGLRWVDELTPRHRPPQPLLPAGSEPSPLGRLEARTGFAWREFLLPQGDFRLKVVLRAGPGTKSFGLNIRGEPGYRGGAELRCEPNTGRVQWGYAGEGCLAPAAIHPRCWVEDMSIEGVEGLADLITIEVIAHETILDACLNDQRTALARRHNLRGDRLFLFVEEGSLEFEPPLAGELGLAP